MYGSGEDPLNTLARGREPPNNFQLGLEKNSHGRDRNDYAQVTRLSQLSIISSVDTYRGHWTDVTMYLAGAPFRYHAAAQRRENISLLLLLFVRVTSLCVLLTRSRIYTAPTLQNYNLLARARDANWLIAAARGERRTGWEDEPARARDPVGCVVTDASYVICTHLLRQQRPWIRWHSQKILQRP